MIRTLSRTAYTCTRHHTPKSAPRAPRRCALCCTRDADLPALARRDGALGHLGDGIGEARAARLERPPAVEELGHLVQREELDGVVVGAARVLDAKAAGLSARHGAGVRAADRAQAGF